MQTIIETIEQTILQKKQEMKYNQQEINRIQMHVSDTSNEIYRLENELASLRQLMDSQRMGQGHSLSKSF